MPCAFCGEWVPGNPQWRQLDGIPRAWRAQHIVYWSTDENDRAWATACNMAGLDSALANLRAGRRAMEAALRDLDVVFGMGRTEGI